MIVTKSPLRVSFVGGGSDLPNFCSKEQGVVVSSAISESVFVIINQRRTDGKIRVSYNQTELVDEIPEIQHDIVRETLLMFLAADKGWDPRGLEIASFGDLPAQTGLGSSGAFTVGLIQALAFHLGNAYSPSRMSEMASFVEILRCKKPIGYQDQTASAFGGLKLYRFDDRQINEEDLWRIPYRDDLQKRLLLVDLGSRGPSSEPLEKLNLSEGPDQSQNMATIRSMANLAETFRDAFIDGKIDECGEILDASWSLKRSLEGVTNPEIDSFYEFAKEHGAIGGKLCGAGGRGMFLLLLGPGEFRRESLGMGIKQEFGYRTLGVQFEPQGSRVVYSSF